MLVLSCQIGNQLEYREESSWYIKCFRISANTFSASSSRWSALIFSSNMVSSATCFFHFFVPLFFVRSFITWVIGPPTHPPIQPFNISFIHSFIHSVSQSVIHSFLPSFVHSFIRSFVRSFVRSFTHSLIHSFTHSFILHSFIHSFHFISFHFISFQSVVQSVVHSFIHSFIHSVIQSVIQSFIHSFIHSFVRVPLENKVSCKEPFYSMGTPAFLHLLLQHPWSNASGNKAITNQSKTGQKTNRPKNEVNLKNLEKSQNCVEVKRYFTTRTRMRQWLENNKCTKLYSTLMARLPVHETGDAAVRNIYKHTSSTAQGGGGSFKKRKTIGEIGCCESRVSKQKHWPTD